MVEGTVFVEEGPPSTGFRCGGLEAGLRPRDPGGARFADANAQRFRYEVPKAPPEQGRAVASGTRTMVVGTADRS
jgi:hypothetical protein